MQWSRDAKINTVAYLNRLFTDCDSNFFTSVDKCQFYGSKNGEEGYVNVTIPGYLKPLIQQKQGKNDFLLQKLYLDHGIFDINFQICLTDHNFEFLTKDIAIANADCMAVMSNMLTDYCELVLTDIPYAEVNRESGGLRTFDKGEADEISFKIYDFIKELIRICSGSFYVFCGQQQYSEIDSIFRRHECSTRTIVYEKTNPAPINGDKLWLSGIELCVFARKSKATFNGHCLNTVLKYPSGSSKYHPTEKPLELFRHLIDVSSNAGDRVFDPCLGSGTAGVAAARSGRKFIGCELNPEYYKYARNRIDQSITVHDSQLFDSGISGSE